MTQKKRKLPSFKSDRVEREFWSRHSVEEFGDELEDLDIKTRPARSERIALRLYKSDLEKLKKVAKRRGVGHTTLAQSIVERWVAISQRAELSRTTLAAPIHRSWVACADAGLRCATSRYRLKASPTNHQAGHSADRNQLVPSRSDPCRRLERCRRVERG